MFRLQTKDRFNGVKDHIDPVETITFHNGKSMTVWNGHHDHFIDLNKYAVELQYVYPEEAVHETIAICPSG